MRIACVSLSLIVRSPVHGGSVTAGCAAMSVAPNITTSHSRFLAALVIRTLACLPRFDRICWRMHIVTPSITLLAGEAHVLSMVFATSPSRKMSIGWIYISISTAFVNVALYDPVTTRKNFPYRAFSLFTIILR
jgi:hypothetical protein